MCYFPVLISSLFLCKTGRIWVQLLFYMQRGGRREKHSWRRAVAEWCWRLRVNKACSIQRWTERLQRRDKWVHPKLTLRSETLGLRSASALSETKSTERRLRIRGVRVNCAGSLSESGANTHKRKIKQRINGRKQLQIDEWMDRGMYRQTNAQTDT